MTSLEALNTAMAYIKHIEIGVKLDKNQTIVKGQVYGFIGSGYSLGKGHGYYTITITKAKTNDYFRIPAHWNREIFSVIDGCDKIHGGTNGGNTAFDRKVAEYKKEYPDMIWV